MQFFRTKRPPCPAERTLLTTGLVDAMMASRDAGGRRLPTPQLAGLGYASYTEPPIRPTGPPEHSPTWVRQDAPGAPAPASLAVAVAVAPAPAVAPATTSLAVAAWADCGGGQPVATHSMPLAAPSCSWLRACLPGCLCLRLYATSTRLGCHRSR